MATSKHVRSLIKALALHASPQGSITRLTVEEFPLLDRLSLKRVVVKPGALREPHWHVNAYELAYGLAGSRLITIVDNSEIVSTFTLRAGQMSFVRSGSLHAFENVGTPDAELIVAFSHESPSNFSLRATFGAMTDAVLGNTFGLPAAALAALKRDTCDPYLLAGGEHPVSAAARSADPHRFDLQAQTSTFDYPYGTAPVARAQFQLAFDGIAMHSIEVGGDGMREVHWHPKTAEMGYVHRGWARMTVLDPDGSAETHLPGPGDAYFVPRAYPPPPTGIGRPRPAWRGRACRASQPPSCSTGRSTAPPSRPTSTKCWCPNLPPATSW